MKKKLTFHIPAVILILFLTVNLISSQQKPQYLAMITEIKGDAKIKKAKNVNFEPAFWGTHLYEDDQIKTLNNTEVSISFMNGNLISLGSNSIMRISEGRSSNLKKLKSIKIIDERLAEEMIRLTMYKSENGEMGALAGLRSNNLNSKISLLSPGNSKIKSTKPSFEWKSDTKFEKYKVRLYDSNGPVWTEETSKTKIIYPRDKDPLKPGATYFWQVEGDDLFESFKSNSVGFNISTDEELAKITTKEKSVKEIFKNNPDNNTMHLMLGIYYEKHGFIEEAISKFDLIAKSNPDAPKPHEILGKLYTRIGLKNKAINELKKALELSQQRE